MRFLVLQHAASEDIGVFGRLMAADGHRFDAVDLSGGAALPALDPYDGLWVMGGAMQVWEEAEFPWIAAEKALIREAVRARDMACFGICLGHQLLAEALGGAVGPAALPEIGVCAIEGASDWFGPGPVPVLQWHSAEVTELPAGAQVLARSEACAVQAVAWGPRVLSTQFHAEAQAETVPNWLADPVYHADLVAAEGPEVPGRMMRDAAVAMEGFQRLAAGLYRRWIAAL